jgi:energy-coupling factor transporter ATP-binding protein EcfA2
VPRFRRRATLDRELAFNVVGAAFLINEGREIIVDPLPHADPAAVRMVLLGRVMAFLLRQRGWLPLHASGLTLDKAGDTGKCVLFLGSAGAGKSTLAAAFHQAGHLVITDDVAPVKVATDGMCLMQSALSYVRLKDKVVPELGKLGLTDPMRQGDKFRYDLVGPSLRDAYRVDRAYVIEYGSGFSIEPLSGPDAVMMLSRHSFVKHRDSERPAMERHLKHCAAVAAILPVRRLIRPRSIKALGETVRLVEDDLSASPPHQR